MKKQRHYEKTKQVVKEISYKEYQKATNLYYQKSFLDYMIIIGVVILTFLIG